MAQKIYTLDTTLRDGMQGMDVSFSVEDKLKIVTLLDELGIDFIEAGNPGSNIKDEEFFKKAMSLPLTHSKIIAFGSTRKVGITAEEDDNLCKLCSASTDIVVIFGKAWDLHVFDVLRTTPEENINMIKDSIRYLREQGKEVFFDAEHFFDGYKNNPEYALDVLRAAADSGASYVVLCDTNGGTFSQEIIEITQRAAAAVSTPIGIHTHNDCGMAVATTIAGVIGGATQVQGTLTGIGERCGNANLSTIMTNLQLKMGFTVTTAENLQQLTPITRSIAEISNSSTAGMPYVSKSAFAHKAGMHINAVLKNPKSFEHIAPELVGNERNILLSEMAGRSAILPLIQKIMPDIDRDSPMVDTVLKNLKNMEFKGYQYEAAEASMDLAIRKALGIYNSFFDVQKFTVLVEQTTEKESAGASAVIKVAVGDAVEITAADSDGPVHAIDIALRKALHVFYPILDTMQLIDYKVRVLNSEAATAAMVRVLIDTTDGKNVWSTVGVSTDVIEASKIALIDSIEYKLTMEKGD